MCEALSLISFSIYNVRSTALWLGGADPSRLRFSIPEEEAFRKPLGRSPGVASTNMNSVVLKGAVREFGKEELRREIREGIGQLRARLDPAPPRNGG